MPQPRQKARTPIQRILDRLDEALWEMTGDETRTPMSNRGLERIVPVSQTQLGRWRNGQPVLKADLGERFAKAIGLEVGHTLGVLELPPREVWPSPALVRRMADEHKRAGRPPKPPAPPAPTAPPEMHRLVSEMRDLMAAMRGGVAPPAPGHVGSTKVGLAAGEESVATAEELAAMAERLERLAEVIAAHDARATALWEGAAAERAVIAARLERIERILSHPLLDRDGDGPEPPDMDGTPGDD